MIPRLFFCFFSLVHGHPNQFMFSYSPICFRSCHSTAKHALHRIDHPWNESYLQGTGNANFYFAINLVYATLQVRIFSYPLTSHLVHFINAVEMRSILQDFKICSFSCILFKISVRRSFHLSKILFVMCLQTVLIVESASTVIRFDRNLLKQIKLQNRNKSS